MMLICSRLLPLYAWSVIRALVIVSKSSVVKRSTCDINVDPDAEINNILSLIFMMSHNIWICL